MKKNNTKIAVYGTLRKGFSNSDFLRNSKFLDIGWTKEKYKLSALGIPYVNPKEKISNIRVEVYEVTPEELISIDRLEGYNPNNHSNSWYKRTPVEVKLDSGEKVVASIYFNETEKGTIIKSGDFKDY